MRALRFQRYGCAERLTSDPHVCHRILMSVMGLKDSYQVGVLAAGNVAQEEARVSGFESMNRGQKFGP
jgi:hypothetical protein